MLTPDPHSALLIEMIGHIYEAAFDGNRWKQLLNQFATLVRADAAACFLHDFAAAPDGAKEATASFAVTHGLPDAAVLAYATHFGAVNPWAAREDALQPGQAVSSSGLYPDHLLPRTEFYNDFLRPHGVFYSMGGVADKTDSLALKFSFMRAERQGAYEPHELAWWQALVPHVQRAARLHARLAHQDGRARDAEAALSGLAGDLIVLGADGRVQRIDPQVLSRLRPASGLWIDAQGRVLATRSSVDADLQRAIRAALSPGDALQATRQVLDIQGPEGRWRVEVMPLPAADPKDLDVRRCALLVSPFEDPAARALVPALQRTYGMTPSEALLTEALVFGRSLAQVAEERAVSIHTVRTQLKAATAKAGAKRQADLVRIILTGPAMRPTR